jgi:hypothetical protein
VDGRHDGDVGAGKARRDGVLGEHTRKADPVRDSALTRPGTQFGIEIAAAADDESDRGPPRRKAPDGVNQVLEALLSHEPTGGEEHQVVRASAHGTPPFGPQGGIGAEALRVDAVRNGHGARRIRAEGNHALTQVVAARRQPIETAQGGSRCDARKRVSLGDVHVRPVQADHHRQIESSGGHHGAARDDPVAVEQRRADRRRDTAHGVP